MSITFTNQLQVPSELTALPNQFKRPAFGTLYGFDAQQGGGSAIFSVGVVGLQAAILVRTGDPDGTIAYATDTDNYYIFNGDVWFSYPKQQ